MKKLLPLLFLFSITLVQAQSEKEKVEKTVNKSTIKEHIYYLASDELKGRETGEPGADQAADYIAQKLKSYGVKPVPGATDGYFQEIKFEKIKPANQVSVKLDGSLIEEAISLTHANLKLSDELVFLNYGMADDYQSDANYKGKIVLVKVGTSESNAANTLYASSMQKRALAREKGVKALIEYDVFEGPFWNNVKNYFSHESFNLAQEESNAADITHLWLKTTGDLSTVKKAELEISGVAKETVTSKNVVGILEGTDPKLKDEFIIYSAHYDHVGVGQPNAEGDSIYNGARDNAVGTVTVLSAAENLAKFKAKRSSLFILFTAEEKGLLGSKYYVEHPLLPLNKMVYCFNSDNASYNDTSKATIVGLNRTTASAHILKAAEAFGLTAIDDPAPEQNLFDRSDNVHFAAKGIPAPTFSLGFTSFDQEVFKYYHQPSDNPETLDYDYLEKFFSAYVLSCRYIANSEETPFWIEGDKYYEAGTGLYNK